MEISSTTRDRLILPLDVASTAHAMALVDTLVDTISYYKIGHQLAFAGGLELIGELQSRDKKIFLDMKLLDIDNTVAKGIESILKMGVNMTTVHAYPKAMRAAVEAARESDLTLLGVTVLTSMDDNDLTQAGYTNNARDLVLRRAEQARDTGMGGVVTSAREAAEVRAILGPDLAIVTPGIRPTGASSGDQKRVTTPSDALNAGASHLVVGRPITATDDPVLAANAILAEMQSALDSQLP